MHAVRGGDGQREAYEAGAGPPYMVGYWNRVRTGVDRHRAARDLVGHRRLLLAALCLMLATFVAARVHRLNRRFIATVSAIGGFFAASQIVDSLGDSSTFERISDLLGLFGSICIIIALINMLSGRASANIRSVLGDALIVGLGSWLITWVALIEPTLKIAAGHSVTRSSTARTSPPVQSCSSCSFCCSSPVPATGRPPSGSSRSQWRSTSPATCCGACKPPATSARVRPAYQWLSTSPPT